MTWPDEVHAELLVPRDIVVARRLGRQEVLLAAGGTWPTRTCLERARPLIGGIHTSIRPPRSFDEERDQVPARQQVSKPKAG